MSLVRASGHHDLLLAHDAGRRVPTGTNWLCIVKFNRWPVIDIYAESLFDGIDIAA